MKTRFSVMIGGLMLLCIPVIAQTKRRYVAQDSILELMAVRKFPYTGKIDLSQNYPNPFSVQSATTIRFKAIDALSAQLLIYTYRGAVVHLINLEPGVGEIVLNEHALESGVYLYALIVNGRRVVVKRMIIIDDTISSVE